MSVIWELDSNFDPIDNRIWFGKTAIHSVHSLTYEQAQNLVDGQDPGFTTEDAKACGGPIPDSIKEGLVQDIRLLMQIERRHRFLFSYFLFFILMSLSLK